jgi:pimeloyl-ACP methyl ester carboxylesterase
MRRSSVASKLSQLLGIAAWSVALASLSSCQLLNIKRQSETIDARVTVHGKVDVAAAGQGLVYVMMARAQDEKFEVTNKVVLPRSGAYRFNVLAGEYFIGAFVDVNGDTMYQSSEPATYLGVDESAPRKLRIDPHSDREVENLKISHAINADANVISYKLTKAYENVGRIVSLEDPMFSLANASVGFWRALDYVSEFGGGLMMLQDYEPGKMPVVFVHGIFGSALEFKDVVASLDRSRYQPWVMQYPSGAPLDVVSDYLADALSQLNVKYGFKEIVVVAHSMGGLVTRSFVMKHEARRSRYRLAKVFTINSPLYGMDSAASGVKSSPIVVPVWRDVAAGSEFVARLHAWHWPVDVPYFLIFSYMPGEEGDGVVPLRSQLSNSLQEEATVIRGVQAQHAEILHDAYFIQLFNEMLAKPRSEALPAVAAPASRGR